MKYLIIILITDSLCQSCPFWSYSAQNETNWTGQLAKEVGNFTFFGRKRLGESNLVYKALDCIHSLQPEFCRPDWAQNYQEDEAVISQESSLHSCGNDGPGASIVP